MGKASRDLRLWRCARFVAGAFILSVVGILGLPSRLAGQVLPRVENVAQQPLAAQILRLDETMDFLGAPFKPQDKAALRRAVEETNASESVQHIQDILDPYVLFGVQINAEERVDVFRGPAKPVLVEQGWRAFLVKVINQAGVTAELKVESPNSGPVYITSTGSPRPKLTLTNADIRNRWLNVYLYDKRPLEAQLSGLALEYAIVEIYSRDAGKREAKISFNVGQGTQDIGFKNDVNVVFTCLPATTMKLRVLDQNGQPTIASFIFQDQQGRIYPFPDKRLAPDFYFQPQVYRGDGESITLPPGEYTVEYTRGPEYLVQKKAFTVGEKPETPTFHLKRWINMAALAWYSGDDHIHPAGCSHYQDPSQGVYPKDMIRQIIGEGLSVGNVLDWAPCWYFQKQFITGRVSKLSRPDCIMRYDVEVSGFPSSFNGHLVLLNLKSPDYPGTTEIEQWPTWDLPILRWVHTQGAIGGYAHSGWGLEVRTDQLPNYAMPPFDGIGANEYIVDVTYPGAVDFISAGDTPAIWELSIWYHTLNCGFRVPISGETDFPCIFDERAGVGRVYVQVNGKLTYQKWIEGVRTGRSYVSDGKSHLPNFKVNGVMVGTQNSEVRLARPGTIHVTAQVAAWLSPQPDEAIHDLPYDQKPYWSLERARIGNTREVPLEVVVNARSVAHQDIEADGTLQKVSFDVPIKQSSWVALRILYSSHTNPIYVIVGGQPIRASRESAEWCLRAVNQCWRAKQAGISSTERSAAAAAYAHAREVYRRILAQSHTP